MIYAVYFYGSSDERPVYKNDEGDFYKAGEIVALFGDSRDTAEVFANTFTGYGENGEFRICAVHPSTQVGTDAHEFWEESIPKEVLAGWKAYYQANKQ